MLDLMLDLICGGALDLMGTLPLATQTLPPAWSRMASVSMSMTEANPFTNTDMIIEQAELAT